MKKITRTALLAAALLAAPSFVSADVILTDSFDATGDANTDLATRQTGPIATTSYIQNGAVSTDSDELVLGSGAFAILDFDLGATTGPVVISFDGTVTGAEGEWFAFALNDETDTGFITFASTEFGILFRGNGDTQQFDSGTGATSDSFTGGGVGVPVAIEITLSDIAGTGSPFSGSSTLVTASANGTVVASTEIDPITSGHIAFGAGTDVSFNNLVIEADSVFIPEPASLALLSLGGLAVAGRRRRA